MHYMLCKHRVIDFNQWYGIFKSHEQAQHDAGLHLLHLLHDTSNANHVVYLFRVDDVTKARTFTQAPEAEKAADDSGVIGPFELLLLHD